MYFRIVIYIYIIILYYIILYYIILYYIILYYIILYYNIIYIYTWVLHSMCIRKLYPTHMWYKNLESILAASGSLTLLTFLDCENVLQIKTVWRKHPWSKRPRAGHLQDKASFWRCRGPAAKAEGKKATGFAHASGEEATHLAASSPEATVQRTSQGRTTKSPSQRLQWLERHLCLQWFARQRCNRDGFFRHPESTRKPLRLETHLGDRVQ